MLNSCPLENEQSHVDQKGFFGKGQFSFPLTIKSETCLPSHNRCDIPVRSSRSSSYLCTSPCRELCSHGLWGSFWSSWQTVPEPPLALPPGALEGQGHGQFHCRDPALSHPGHWENSVFLCGHGLSLLFFNTMPSQRSLLTSAEGRNNTVILSFCLRPYSFQSTFIYARWGTKDKTVSCW